MEGLIQVWYLIDFKHHLKQKMHFGSKLYTGVEGKNKIKNGSEVSNLSHYEGRNNREIVLRNANAGVSFGCRNVFVVLIICSSKEISRWIFTN